jgi:formate-dependent nitrite reductase cytochrome c552 subunit
MTAPDHKAAPEHKAAPRPGLCIILLTAGILRAVTSSAAEPVDLDDVYCAMCHYDQGDEFAAGVHYQEGLLLCNDCHGGLPFEVDEEVAKAPETGFIGKPSRDQIAQLCGTCHVGPAEFLASGPHGDVLDPESPTCVSCHSNHRVEPADLSLMDNTCDSCHTDNSTAAMTGTGIRDLLLTSWTRGERVSSEFDSLSAANAKLRREEPRLRAAFASLRQADSMTHAWNAELIADQVAEFRDELSIVESGIQEHKEGERLRLRLVAGIWIFVVLNLVLLRRQRRSGHHA